MSGRASCAEAKARMRERRADHAERMRAGEESALLPRDRGPVRRYDRNDFDARYNQRG